MPPLVPWPGSTVPRPAHWSTIDSITRLQQRHNPIIFIVLVHSSSQHQQYHTDSFHPTNKTRPLYLQVRLRLVILVTICDLLDSSMFLYALQNIVNMLKTAEFHWNFFAKFNIIIEDSVLVSSLFILPVTVPGGGQEAAVRAVAPLCHELRLPHTVTSSQHATGPQQRLQLLQQSTSMRR